MQAFPSSFPNPARFGHLNTTPPAMRFGAKGAGGTGAPPPADDAPPEEGTQPNVLETVKQALTQQGLVQGVKQFAATLSQLLTWNKLLDEANGDSAYPTRLLAVLDIAYARFREGYNSKNEDGTSDPVNYKLYQNVLNKFPALALQDGGELPVNLTEQLVAASEDPDGLKARLDELKDTYTDVTQIPAEELKEKVSEAIST